MQRLRQFFVYAALGSLLLLASACSTLRELSSIKDIGITSCSIVSVTPRGLKSADAVLAIGIHNPSIAFTITELDASVRTGNVNLAKLVGGPIAVERQSDNVYEVPCTASLLDNLNLLKLVALVTAKNLDNCMVDITADVMLANGLSRRLTLGEIPLQKLIDRARKASQ